MRQEKGQDIAGACGQLALVNPGNVTAPAVGGDIEDMAGSGGAGRTSAPASHMTTAAVRHTATDSSTAPASAPAAVTRAASTVTASPGSMPA